jgi:hypothetical protein
MTQCVPLRTLQITTLPEFIAYFILLFTICPSNVMPISFIELHTKVFPFIYPLLSFSHVLRVEGFKSWPVPDNPIAIEVISAPDWQIVWEEAPTC